MTKQLQTIGLLCLLLVVAMTTKAADVTALWDFQNANPATITSVNYQGTTGDVASTVDGITMHVDATNSGKLQYNASNYAQFNANTIIQVPVEKE